MWLTRISIKNPVFASMMMLALMVLGLFSWRELSVVISRGGVTWVSSALLGWARLPGVEHP